MPQQGDTFRFWMIFVMRDIDGDITTRGWLQKVRFCECCDNPATGTHYSSLGQAERICKALHDSYGDTYIPRIIECSATQLTDSVPELRGLI